MMNFWNEFFTKHETSWGFEPSDSALSALDLFRKNEFHKILIPGIGYGRNAKPFYDDGFQITGIEISKQAIRLAKKNGFNYTIYEGSLIQMPFDNEIYDGIFCYATLHLFNKTERHKILTECYNQLKKDGIMFFNVVSEEAIDDFKGESIEKNVLKLENGLEVTFYDRSRIEEEFKNYHIIEITKIDEPIKYMENQKPLKCYNVICKKIRNNI